MIVKVKFKDDSVRFKPSIEEYNSEMKVRFEERIDMTELPEAYTCTLPDSEKLYIKAAGSLAAIADVCIKR